MNRRRFVGTAATCAAHLLAISAGATARARRAFAAVPQGRVVARELWGRLEEVGPGLWALISTPLAGERGSDAWRTIANGGIIAGRDDVLVIEATASDEGAQWLAEQARELTGRFPTVGVVTHFHGDHCGGLAGYRGDGWRVTVRATRETRDLLGDQSPLPEASLPEMGASTTLDLGGRTARVVSRDGHTPSDVSIEVEDPPVVWCGDLVWNGMFPNYIHAIPSKKATSVRGLRAADAGVYVPGHGDLANSAAIDRYLTLLDDVEQHARAAIARGDAMEDAAAAYRIPPGVGEWFMFSPRYFRVAFEAWERELAGTP